MKTKVQISLIAILVFAVFTISGCVINPVSSPEAIAGGGIVIKVASSSFNPLANKPDTPYDTGLRAANYLKEQMGNTPVHAVVIAEYFDNKSAKKQALKGVCEVFDSSIVYGFASYGSFGQDGCSDNDTVRVIGIGGEGIQVSAALEENLGAGKLTMEDNYDELQKILQNAGESITGKLPKSKDSKLMILIPDAHSPKNAFFVEGAHKVVGKDFPITGGSANKNPGQTYVYYQGKMFSDSAIALMLSGDFTVSMVGKKAKEKKHSMIVSTAGEGFAEALSKLDGKPIAAFAFNCAGRKGVLDNLEEELIAIQKEFGTETPIFGTYCAGEIGPADVAEKPAGVLSTGNGWHLMLTILGR